MNNEKQKLVPELRFPEFIRTGDWDETTLEQVADYENGKAHEKEISETGKYKVVNSKFISTDGEVVKYTDSANLKANIGDILMVLSDIPNGKAIAKCFYVNEEDTYTVNQRICKITPIDIDNKFLFYIQNRNKYFLAFDDGVKQTNLRKDTVLSFPFLKPKDPKEQQKIATCLSSLDEVITAENEKLDLLKDHKKGLLQQLFPAEGETQPKFRFPEFKNDGDWEETTLGVLSEIKTGTSNRQDSTEEAGAYTFFDRSQDIRTSSRFLFDTEAIIVAGEGQEFKPKYFVGKFDLHQRAYAIIHFKNGAIGKFLFYLIHKKSGYFFRYAVGSTVKSLRLPIFEKMPISVPTNPKEQQKIANSLSSVDELIESQTKKVKALKKHKKGLMQQLFPKINSLII